MSKLLLAIVAAAAAVVLISCSVVRPILKCWEGTAEIVFLNLLYLLQGVEVFQPGLFRSTYLHFTLVADFMEYE